MASGSLVEETLDYDGGRRVSVYVPDVAPEVVVFAGDGQLIAPWGSLLEAADLPTTMVVGAHGLPDETLRIQEYSRGASTAAFAFDHERFEAHERFFVGDLRRWVRQRFDVDLSRERTAVCGVSAGGELALAMGLRHPDVYGHVLCASPGGGYRPTEDLAGALPRVYLVAGTDEPWFLENARRWSVALRDAGAEVVLREQPGTHGGELWKAAFPGMVAWVSGR